MNKILRTTIALAVVSFLVVAAAGIVAADSPGASPESGIAPTCTYQSLAAGGSMWYKIPYTFDNRLEFTLDDYGLADVEFTVYDSPTADQPVGVGAYDANEPHDLNWEGQLVQNGFYYVLVSNSNPYSVPYNFCTNEKLPWHSYGQDPCLFNPTWYGCIPNGTVTWKGKDYSCPDGWMWVSIPKAPSHGLWVCKGGS